MTTSCLGPSRNLTLDVVRQSFPGPLDDPHVGDFSTMDFKAEHGSDLVKARDACSSRIEMQSAPMFHFLHKKDVAVATDK